MRIFFHSFLLFSLFLILNFTQKALALEAIFTPEKLIHPKVFLSIKKYPVIKKIRPVFSRNEKLILAEIGKPYLAKSFIATFSKESELLTFRSWLEEKKIPGKIDLRSRSQFSNIDQWGLQNTGTPQAVWINDLVKKDIPGVSGEDIQFNALPQENPKKKIRVAILDTGVDWEHPDLKDHLLFKKEECSAWDSFQACKKDCTSSDCRSECDQKWAHFDSDQNGYPMDCLGWNVTGDLSPTTGIKGDPDTRDTRGHGTHVAGIIGAIKNDLGVQGVLQNVEILPVSVIERAPNAPIKPQQIPSPIENHPEKEWNGTFTDVVARGLLYSIHSKAKVINLSLAWPLIGENTLFKELLELAFQKGIIIVAAAGNDSTIAPTLPCAYPGVICVGSHGPDGALSHFSNYGPGVDLSAPGLSIASTWPLSKRSNRLEAMGYELKDGTSMAAPFVTGAVARMLNTLGDIKKEEALSRMVLSARTSLRSRFRHHSLETKFTRSGNLDLSQAFRVQPQPLVYPKNKKTIFVKWNQKQNHLPVQFTFENLWKPSKNTKIDTNILVKSSLLRLQKSSWHFKNWNTKESKTLLTKILIPKNSPKKEIPGSFYIEFIVSTDSSPEKRYYLEVEIRVPFSPEGREAFEIDQKLWKDSVYFRSIKPFESELGVNPNPEYMVIREKAKSDQSEIEFQLLSPDPHQSKKYLVKSSGSIPKGAFSKTSHSLAEIQRVDINQDGSDDYIFIFRPSGRRTNNFFITFFFDQNLQPLSVPYSQEESPSILKHTNDLTSFAADFHWLKIKLNHQNWLTPAWIQLGKLPTQDLPPFDPVFKDIPMNFPGRRYYYYDSSGLRSLNIPESEMSNSEPFFSSDKVKNPKIEKLEDYSLVSLIPQRMNQRRNGESPVLLAKVDHSEIIFATAVVRNLKFDDFTPIVGIENQRYRNLLRSYKIITARNIDPYDTSPRVVYYSQSSPGSLGVTLFEGFPFSRQLDFQLHPFEIIDSVRNLSDIYIGNTIKGAFSQTHYQHQYHDLVTGELRLKDIRRYSFISDLVFSDSFYSVLVGDSQNPEEHLPGLYVDGNISELKGMRVLVPEYNTHGELVKIADPAVFHLDISPECIRMGNPIQTSSKMGSQIIFICGSQMIRVPLSF